MTDYELDCFALNAARAIVDELETRRLLGGRTQKVAIIQCEIVNAVREQKVTLEAHSFREMVNAARDIAIKYHDHQSLRDHMSHALAEFCELGGNK